VVDLLCGDIAKTHKHSRKLNNINKKGKQLLVFFNAKWASLRYASPTRKNIFI